MSNNIPNQQVTTSNNKPNNNKPNNRPKFMKDILTPIGILDPEGKYKNPLTNEPYTEKYFEGVKFWSVLPMYEVREKALKIISEHQVTLVVSGTGSGKTVLTPKFMLHLLNYRGKIVVTIPKQAPVKEAAEFAANNLDVTLGQQVGYKYRGSPADAASKSTNLLYATDGLLLEKLKRSDPLLKEFDAIIIDEAHERNVRIDFLLLMLKRVLKQRPELKLIIMSATIDEKVFLDYYKDFNIGHLNAGEKPNFPVTQHFLEKPINEFDDNKNLIDNSRPPAFLKEAVKKVIHILTTTQEGEILVFLTGSGDLNEACILLNQELKKLPDVTSEQKIFCAPLKGSGLTQEEKNYAIKAVKYKNHPNGPYTRKVIMSTEVAESSLTVENLDFVIDTGLANVDRYYSDKGMTALEKVYITKAQHKQRAGRTGRQKPGTCYNIFTEEEYNTKFLDFPEPPILHEDLTEQVLNLLSSDYITHAHLPFTYPESVPNQNKVGGASRTKATRSSRTRSSRTKSTRTPDNENRENFINMADANSTVENIPPQSLNEVLSQLITRPPPHFIENSLRLLFALGALSFDPTNNTLQISPMGQAMAKFSGIPPQMARSIIASYTYMCKDDVTEIAAITEVSGNQMEQILMPFKLSPKVKKIKDPREQKQAELEERRAYEKSVAQWVNPYGDHIALLRIYQAYKARAYDKTRTDPRTGETIILEPKLGEPKQWCKENHIKEKNISKVKNRVKEYAQKLKYIVSDSRRHQYGGDATSEPNHDFLKNIDGTNNAELTIAEIITARPTLHDKHEDNILQALMEGYHVNTGINTWKKNYVSCFPKEHVMGMPDRNSTFQYLKTTPKLIFAEELRSIFGRIKFNVVSKVPDKVLKSIPKQRLKLCLAAELKNREEAKKRQKQSSSKHQSKGKTKGKHHRKGKSKGKRKTKGKRHN